MDKAIKMKLTLGIYGDLKPDKDLGYTKGTSKLASQIEFIKTHPDWSCVLVLGDSFTQGFNADQGQGYVDHLNRYFENQKILFVNTGVGGYGQNNELAVLKKYDELLKPQAVLLAIYSGNDLTDNLTPLNRYTELSRQWVNNYQLSTTKSKEVLVRKRSGDEVLRCYQALYCHKKNTLWIHFIYHTRLGALCKTAATKAGLWGKISKMIHPGLIDHNVIREKGVIATEGYLKEIVTETHQRNIPLGVILIPDFWQSTDHLIASTNYKKIRTLLKKLNIQALDLLDSLTLSDYVPKNLSSKNDHWNNSGHKKAALAIRDYLKGRILKSS